ncbi:hypothetical protein V8B55DRAFT_1507691 [Mucor lusitanicus]
MTNNINKEDDTETALDYIQRQEKLEKDAQDILPGNFDKCTFSLGYIRQPLYACKTCTVDQNEEPAGMCYSCSIACHASHDLFELFPKRAFRCDCGLSGKFGGHACSRMVPEKLEFATNEKNQYNHNFMNLYCSNWFHERCIGNIPEAIDEFDCYICRDCTKKYPFLMNGNDAKFSYGLSKGDAPIHQWILPESQSSKAADSETAATTNGALDAEPTAVGNQDIVCLDQGDATTGEKRKREEEEESTNKQDIIANVFKKARCESNCQNVDTSLLPEHDHIEIFLQDDWRQSLCKCVKCMEDYKTNQVEYLLEEEQTVEPENDEDVGKSLLEVGMEQLQRMDRVQAIESVRAFQTLASDLKQFFGTFKEEGKIVTKEDVQEYFDAKRRERQQQQ